MLKQVLLDTDIISEFLRGNPILKIAFEYYLNEFDNLNMSIITYYEIMNGLLYKDAKKQLSKFEEFVELSNVLPLQLNSAKKAAEIYANLRSTGKEIGHTDTLIAACAIVNNLQLITNNTSHFERIQELDVSNWLNKTNK